ncbi:methenyltetrahydrofolate synthase domain-containing protein [Caerostris extrusa]|uniref:Methenyltetrahydrofolate synthase domain-containing protein n=1 Tax=Caerostris extrusa TaxID=172846 RepID=A0AAV4XG88_CAEEX|nr:methenyltetrahydrofolate synthase domain-containing protein [Caerostris extrusa]
MTIDYFCGFLEVWRMRKKVSFNVPPCKENSPDAGRLNIKTMDITKESIREQVWSYLETSNIARYPRPVYNKIPNFAGAEKACCKVKQLKEYRTAKIVKVNPDTPQKHARFLTLQDRKRLLVPTPRLRKGLLNWILVPPNAGKHMLRESSSVLGLKTSLSLNLDTKTKIDLVILGSVAVSPKGTIHILKF